MMDASCLPATGRRKGSPEKSWRGEGGLKSSAGSVLYQGWPGERMPMVARALLTGRHALMEGCVAEQSPPHACISCRHGLFNGEGIECLKHTPFFFFC